MYSWYALLSCSSIILHMNEEPIRVHVRGLNNTPNSVQWGHASMRFTGFTGLFGLVRSRKCRINVASPSFFLGHWYRSHWMHGDPFLALRFCQTVWSLRGALFGSSHMRCYSLTNNVLACCVYTLSACTHVLGMRVFVRNFIFLLFVYKSEQHFSSVRPLGPWNHIPYHKE